MPLWFTIHSSNNYMVFLIFENFFIYSELNSGCAWINKLNCLGKIVPRILKSNNVNRTATATFSTQIAQRKLSTSDPVAKQRVGSTARTNNHNISSINGASIFGGASSLTTSVVHKEKFDRLVSDVENNLWKNLFYTLLRPRHILLATASGFANPQFFFFCF